MKPILFNTEMVRAILDGRKTQTRRIVKPQPPVDAVPYYDRVLYWKTPQRGEGVPYAKPTYAPGDILWVRETWQRTEAGRYIYRADKEIRGGSAYYNEHCRLDGGWHPSIHMPKEAARLFLRVTDMRADRLKDITIDDAIAEGCYELSPIAEFRFIWSKTIKPADRDRYGWAANPWVWVICFERYDPEELEGGADG